MKRADLRARELFGGYSRRELSRAFEQGRLCHEGKPLAKGDSVDDEAGLTLEVGDVAWLVPGGDVEVVHLSDEVVVIDKPVGMHCHPLDRGEGSTALDSVVGGYAEVADAGPDPREGGLCHRLDQHTSGLLCFARTSSSYKQLRAAFAAHRIDKEYLAWVEGEIDDRVVIDVPICHHRAPEKMAPAEHPKARGRAQPATTTVDRLGGHELDGILRSLVRIVAPQGRRHQIRVHLAHAGHPLWSDTLYGAAPSPNGLGHALHAWRLRLPGDIAVECAPPLSFWSAALSQVSCPDSGDVDPARLTEAAESYAGLLATTRQ